MISHALVKCTGDYADHTHTHIQIYIYIYIYTHNFTYLVSFCGLLVFLYVCFRAFRSLLVSVFSLNLLTSFHICIKVHVHLRASL